ncbi:MAG: 5-methyltetrahydropteroyltriglutamate--homocysteine methyltransferase [Hyphomicrobiaceae bacterium]
MAEMLIPTTVVGSYPQPDWLIDRQTLMAGAVPRVRRAEIWRVAEPWLEQAQDDATRLAIRDMELAGIDIITDGEMRRESYSNRFATALEGIDNANPATITQQRAGRSTQVPRVVGEIRWPGPIEVNDVTFLRANTTRPIKITLPGPFTMAQQVVDEHYRDLEALTMAFAAAVNREVHALAAAGADLIQLDEPWLRNNPEAAREFAVKAIDRALAGLEVPTAVHLCFGYAQMVGNKPQDYAFLPELAGSCAQQISIESAQPNIDLAVLSELAAAGKSVMLGVIDLGDEVVETPQAVAGRLRAALKHIPAERLIAAPDCGMKYLPRRTAFGKLKALAEGAAIVRRELG